MASALVPIGLVINAAGSAAKEPTTTAAGEANPPGNNGTIKIDDPPFDPDPDNEPHVGCVFQVDFYGYDKGDLDAQVTFKAHPPTGSGQVLLTDTVFIGEDDNTGGGSEAGLDASETYTLDFTGITPHAKQGFHVKLTISAEGSRGADTKHKVFWVTGCVTPTPTATPTKPPTPKPSKPPTPSETPTETATPTPTETQSETPTPTETPSETPTPTPAPTTPAPTPTEAAAEQLASTGGNGTTGLLGTAAALATGGAALVLISRRRGQHEA